MSSVTVKDNFSQSQVIKNSYVDDGPSVPSQQGIETQYQGLFFEVTFVPASNSVVTPNDSASANTQEQGTNYSFTKSIAVARTSDSYSQFVESYGTVANLQEYHPYTEF